MKFNIRGKQIEVTKPIKDYIQEKIGKLDKYFENPDEITATTLIKIRAKDQTVEVTIPIKKFILRGEETHCDLYAAIDLVVDKLERQIRKNKKRLNKNKIKQQINNFRFDFEEEKDDTKVVKRKQIEVKPMSEEEAILQMNLSDHEFFIYKDLNKNEFCVIYKRKDGNYGVLETK